MDRTEFWKVIQASYHKDTEQQYRNLLEALSQLEAKDICHFGQYAALYSSLSESPATYIACKLMNGSATDDTELYFRLWLLAQGRDVFLGALDNIDTLAELDMSLPYYEFEMLMGAAYTALDEKVEDLEMAMSQYPLAGTEEDAIRAEIRTNPDWTDDEDTLWEQAPVRAPKLYAKFCK